MLPSRLPTWLISRANCLLLGEPLTVPLQLEGEWSASAARLEVRLLTEGDGEPVSRAVAATAHLKIGEIKREEGKGKEGEEETVSLSAALDISFSRLPPAEGVMLGDLPRFQVEVTGRDGENGIEICSARSEWAVGACDFYIGTSVRDLSGSNCKGSGRGRFVIIVRRQRSPTDNNEFLWLSATVSLSAHSRIAPLPISLSLSLSSTGGGTLTTSTRGTTASGSTSAAASGGSGSRSKPG